MGKQSNLGPIDPQLSGVPAYGVIKEFELIASQLSAKDRNRHFSDEQRRIIWNLSTNHQCAYCGDELSWDDFTVDHVAPYSRGGKTDTINAALMHRKCNSKKGNNILD